MSSALLAPEVEIYPTRHRWMVAECQGLADEGRLDGRYEIIDGEVISKMGQKPAYFFSIGRVAHWTNAVFGDAFSVCKGRSRFRTRLASTVNQNPTSQ